jgi:hypothetical protein
MIKCKLNGSGMPSQKPKMPRDLKKFLSNQEKINEVFDIDKNSLNLILEETEKYILLKSECNRLLKKCDLYQELKLIVQQDCLKKNQEIKNKFLRKYVKSNLSDTLVLELLKKHFLKTTIDKNILFSEMLDLQYQYKYTLTTGITVKTFVKKMFRIWKKSLHKENIRRYYSYKN